MDRDPAPPVDPHADLERLGSATDRLLTSVEGLDRDAWSAPSRLPGWSRAHVVSHLTRNADAMVNLLMWAQTGVPRPMYASVEGRAGDIESGIAASPGQAAVDLRAAAERFRAAAQAVPDDRWDETVRGGPGGEGAPLAARTLPWRRLEEVEIHAVDLGLDYTPAHWDPGFTARMLDLVVDGWQQRDDDVALVLRSTDLPGADRVVGSGGPVVCGPSSALLAWVLGRSRGDGLAVEGSAGLPPLPHWR